MTPPFRTPYTRQRRRSAVGMTLLELLVTMTIIVVLVVFLFYGTRMAMFAAQKSNDARQMRAIGAAVAQWAGDHNFGEPMYACNGTGDFPHEALPGKNPVICPGNPARALYNKNDLENSYIQTPGIFFSPLTTSKAPPIDQYDPAQAGSGKYWGTYTWFYPSTTLSQLTKRQFNAIGGNSISKIGREANKNLLMANAYLTPRFKPAYNALFIDGSVRMVADSTEKWNSWFSGEFD